MVVQPEYVYGEICSLNQEDSGLKNFPHRGHGKSMMLNANEAVNRKEYIIE